MAIRGMGTYIHFVPTKPFSKRQSLQTVTSLKKLCLMIENSRWPITSTGDLINCFLVFRAKLSICLPHLGLGQVKSCFGPFTLCIILILLHSHKYERNVSFQIVYKLICFSVKINILESRNIDTKRPFLLFQTLETILYIPQ